jgi:hypothetical protein
LHQAVFDAEEDAFFITAISVRRYTTNCNHAYQIEMMFLCMRATKVYESKGDQYLVVLWPLATIQWLFRFDGTYAMGL